MEFRKTCSDIDWHGEFKHPLVLFCGYLEAFQSMLSVYYAKWSDGRGIKCDSIRGRIEAKILVGC